MGKRRKAREVALQFLYQLDQTGADDPTPFEHDFWKRHPVDDDTRAFAGSLVRGSKAQQAKIDVIIAESTEHWDLARMAVVDRHRDRQEVRHRRVEPLHQRRARPHPPGAAPRLSTRRP
jgi:N utilization substance protein B